MDQRWFEDMMCQTYNEDICFNPSKLFLMQYISRSGRIFETYSIKEFQDYLFRIYIDHPEVSGKHPSYVIRNLGKYGVPDLQEHVMDTLESWDRDCKNGILKFGQHYFAIQVDLNDGEDIAKNTARLSKMIYKKTFSGIMPDIINYDDVICSQNDHDIDTFGVGEFRKRVLEDMQYCPICEEIDIDKLVCVHIVDKEMKATNNELVDKNNGLIFCRSHAKQFIEHKFSVDELGFFHNEKDSDVEEGMHLSFSIRKPRRRAFLNRRMEILYEKGENTWHE